MSLDYDHVATLKSRCMAHLGPCSKLFAVIELYGPISETEYALMSSCHTLFFSSKENNSFIFYKVSAEILFEIDLFSTPCTLVYLSLNV